MSTPSLPLSLYFQFDITRLMKIEVTAESVERPGPINDVSNL